MKKSTYLFLKLFLSILCLFNFSEVYAVSASSHCLTNDNGEIPAITTSCWVEPKLEIVKFFKVSLCTAKPDAVAPSSTQPLDTTSCQVIYNNPGGEEISIQKGVVVNFSDAYMTKPNSGDFAYALVEVAPYIKIQNIVTFDANMTGSASSSGKYCWSTPVDSWGYDNSPNNDGAVCSNVMTLTNYGVSTSYINELNSAGHSVAFDFPATYGRMYAYLMTDDLKLATNGNRSLGTITKAVGIMQQNISINDQTTGLLVNFNVTNGDELNIESGKIYYFKGGPFDLYLTPTQ